MSEQIHPREHVWRVQTGNYPGNFEIMCICNSRCAYTPTLEDAIRFSDILNEHASLTEKMERLEGDYYELLWAVCKKHDGETRHETALRYIQEAERGSGDASVSLDAFWRVSDE